MRHALDVLFSFLIGFGKLLLWALLFAGVGAICLLATYFFSEEVCLWALRGVFLVAVVLPLLGLGLHGLYLWGESSRRAYRMNRYSRMRRP